jgi:hypothetical protein
VTRALKSSTGGRGSSPSKISNTRAFSNGQASSGDRPLIPKELPRLSISVVCDMVCPGVVVWLGVILVLLAEDGHSERSMLKD